MIISAHVLVKNEARFIWYSVMSIINYVDRVRIWDTGSSDGTLKVIDEIDKMPEAKGKIYFQKVLVNQFYEEKLRQGMLNSESADTFNVIGYSFAEVRQQVLNATRADWFLVVDGDEIWWDDSIRKVTEAIRKDGDKLESIVVPTYNVVGDMFHYQERQAGRYHLTGKVGHYNLRAINRKIPGLHAVGEHGIFSWRGDDNVKIESRSKSKIKFIDAPYIHTTHLRRGSSKFMDKQVFKRAMKLKYELGTQFPKDFYYPEVFFKPRPAIVPSVWDTPGVGYKLDAFIQTPPKKIRRRYFMKNVKHGY